MPLPRTLKLFLFDEPTSALDVRYQIEVMETMHQITREQKSSMIVAVHDLNLAYRYADAVVVLNRGRMIAYGKPPDILTPDCISSVYGIDSFAIENEYGQFIVPFRCPAIGLNSACSSRYKADLYLHAGIEEGSSPVFCI